MNTLGGRNVLLTGAAGGIGRHLAAGLVQRGARLAVSGRDAAALEDLADQLGTATVAVVPAELADSEDANALVGRAEEAIGSLDVLVNNAGIELTAAYPSFSRAEIEQIVAVNLTAPMLLVRSALPGMLQRGRGHVVNIASLAGKGPVPYQVPYSVTKAGLVAMTHALRAEFASAPVGFSVVCPGFVEDDGMYARMVDEGLRAPWTFGSSPPAKVVDAMLDAIQRDRPEILVTPRPMRPLLAIAQLAPRTADRLVNAAGVRAFFAAVAERRGRL